VAETDAYRREYTRLFWQEAWDVSRPRLLAAAALLPPGYFLLLAWRRRRPMVVPYRQQCRDG